MDSSNTQNQYQLPSGIPNPPPQTKRFVFVDEHTRKRVKLSRACDRCRIRKVRCDAATNNMYPCAPCVKRSIECVPPTIFYEPESSPSTSSSSYELPKSHTFPSTSSSSNLMHFTQNASQDSITPTDTTEYPSQQPDTMDFVRIVRTLDLGLNGLNAPHKPENQWSPDNSVEGLASAFGDLNVAVDGTSPYIRDQTRLANKPALQEFEPDLPSVMLSPGSRVEIPQKMMPSETQCLRFFSYYFANIHPYLPVLCKAEFYHQWNNDKDSISPLLLEAIFACTSAALRQTLESRQWIALATQHEENYKDSSRLSTLQALLLLMKAREAQPKRGYFYRSWMWLVNIITIGKDLGLADHHDMHDEKHGCNFSPIECMCRTRIWQAIFTLECMIGGPQGRHDFTVRRETVDLSEPQVLAGVPSDELVISKQYVYLAKIAANIRETIRVYRSVKKNFAIHPSYIAMDDNYQAWLRDLPADMQIQIPKHEFEMWRSSSFLGNLNSYAYLSLIMHYRPQFHSFVVQPGSVAWKRPLTICLDAAKNMCRIFEGLYTTFGASGLESMLRGMSYTIYAVLTSACLQLAAITSPYPEINSDAKEYFERSMRLLELCIPFWPMESVRDQINSLRTAFSADLEKPFELKPDFPYAISSTQQSTAQPESLILASGSSDFHFNPPGNAQLNFLQQPLTPPISVVGEEYQSDLPIPHTLPPLNDNLQMLHEQWNPSHILDKWQTAFHAAPQNQSEYSPTLHQINVSPDYGMPPISPGYPPVTQETDNMFPPQSQSLQQQQHHHHHHHHHHQIQSFFPRSSPANLGQTITALPSLNFTDSNHAAVTNSILFGSGPTTPTGLGPTSSTSYTSHYNPATEFVSPSTWQNVVASSFGSRMKRTWEQ